MGKGSRDIIDARQGAEVHIPLCFLKPGLQPQRVHAEACRFGDGGHVSDDGEADLDDRLKGIFTSMDSMVGPDVEKGLAKLEAVALG